MNEYTTKKLPHNKREEVLTHATTWMDLKNMVKWKESVTKDHVLYNHSLSRIGTFIQTEGRLLVAFGGMKSDSQWVQGFYLKQWKCFKIRLWWWPLNSTDVPKTHWATLTWKRRPLRYADYVPTQLFLKTVMDFKCMHLTNAFTILAWFQPQCVASFGDNIKSSEGWEPLGTMEPLV